jgi:hypothetical protein
MATFETAFKSASIPAGQVYNVIFSTGPKGAIFTNRTIGFSGTAGVATVYESPTGVTGGTVASSYKLHNTRTESALGVMTHGVTISDTGTQSSSPSYYRGSTGIGPSVVGTYSTSSSSRVLKANTSYLLQFTNSDAGAQVIDLYFQWREGR